MVKNKIKYIPFEFHRKGSVKGKMFQRMVSTPCCYIYRVKTLYIDNEDGEEKEYTKYDAFKRILVEEIDFETKEKTGLLYEKYPKDEDFGCKAFQFDTMDEAYGKLIELVKLNEDEVRSW